MCKSKNTTKKKANVNRVASDYAFNVTIDNTNYHTEKLPINVSGVMLDMMVDSGASSNIVDANTWDNLKQGKIECTSEKGSGTRLYPYASSERDTNVCDVDTVCARNI